MTSDLLNFLMLLSGEKDIVDSIDIINAILTKWSLAKQKRIQIKQF